MNIRWIFYSLPFLLLISINLTTADPFGSEIENDDSNFETTDSKSPKKLNIASTTLKMYRFVTAGTTLAKQFPYVIPKLLQLAKDGVSIYSVLSILPYAMLATEQVKSNPVALEEFQRAFAELQIQNIDLASLVKDPNLIRKAFMDNTCADIVNDAMQVIAGPNADKSLGLFIEEIVKYVNQNPDGKVISGEKLTELALKSPHFQKLFKDNTQKGLQVVNILMDTILSTQIKEMKNDILNEASQRITAQDNDDQKTDNVKEYVKYKAKNTLTNATVAFYAVAQIKMKEKIKEHNEKAKNIAEQWKVDAEVDRCNYEPGLWNLAKRAKSEVLVFAPTVFLQPFAFGKSVTTEYSRIIPQIAPYFLPAGWAFKALKFVCAFTYVTLVAQKEEIEIPYLSSKVKAKVEVPGLNTDKIISVLNNKSLMKKIFPNDSSKSLKILKFIGGPDILLVDAIVRHIKLYTDGKKIGEVNVMTILNNHKLVKQLVKLNEFSDVKMRQYFNVDSKEEAQKIISQIKQLKEGKLNKGDLQNWVDLGKVREKAYKSFYEKLWEKYAEVTKKANEETIKMKENNDSYLSDVINKIPEEWLQKYNAVKIFIQMAKNRTILNIEKKND